MDFHHQSFYLQFSCKKCCLFLLLFASMLILISGFFSLMIVFILKPRKPIFLFETLDITMIMVGVETTDFTIKVLGDVGVHLQLLQVKLPDIKVGLDCDVAVDAKYLTSFNEISSLEAIKSHIV